VHAEAERLHLVHCSEGDEGNRRVILQKPDLGGPAPPVERVTKDACTQSPVATVAEARTSAPSQTPPLRSAATRYLPPALRRRQQQQADSQSFSSQGTM
jgi:hypothetical protein